MKKLRLWIADDHVVVRNGLRQIADATRDLSVTGESQNGPDTLKAARRNDIDVMLLDLSMPGGGIAIIPDLLQKRPALRILVLTMHAEPQLATQAVKAGACGYVTKDADMAVLLDAVRTVGGGGNFLEPRLVDALLFERVGSTEPSPDALTAREREILDRLAAAERTVDIADSLGCSIKTVSVHKSRLMRKLGIRTNAELFQYAMRQGLGQQRR